MSEVSPYPKLCKGGQGEGELGRADICADRVFPYPTNDGTSKANDEIVEGASAMILTQELLQREVIQGQTAQHYDDGHTMQAFFIHVPATTSLIRRATTGYCTASVVKGPNADAQIAAFHGDPFNDAERELLAPPGGLF